MLRNLILILIAAGLLTSCTTSTKKSNTVASHLLEEVHQVKQHQIEIPLTDSAKLVKHLDSLPKAQFPRKVSDWGRYEPNIDLTEFKGKALFNLKYTRIPRLIGGAGIDMYNNYDSTFNLCDTTYKGNWFLVAKTPKYFVVEVNDGYLKLVTMDYHLHLIDAIDIAAGDPSSNNHFQAELSATIFQNLKIELHYSYSVQTDEQRHFETEDQYDIWRINKLGYFKIVKSDKNKEE